MSISTGRSLQLAATDALRLIRSRPSFGFYLVALLLLPFKWLSPLPYERAGLTDVFVALAAGAWVWEAVRNRHLPRPRGVHYALAAYLGLTLVSALLAADRSTGLENALIVAELIALFLLTSDYGSQPEGREGIVLAILMVTLIIVIETLLAVALFYAGVDTSLEGVYGVDLTPSDLYVRVAAGFYSAPLLGSFCIFAAAVLANDESVISRPLRIAGMVVLAVVVLLTFSRSAIGFVVAAGLWIGHARKTRAARTAGLAIACAGVALMVTLTLGRLRLEPGDPLDSSYEFLDRHDNPRLDGASKSLDTLKEHPVWGLGPGSLTGESFGDPFRAHLTPLNVAATSGLPALLALGSAVALIWRRRRRPTDMATWGGLAGLGVDGLAQDVDHFRHVWILLGFADAGRAGARDESDDPPNGPGSARPGGARLPDTDPRAARR